MSVVTSLEVVPNRITAAARYLHGRKSVSDNEFRAALSPPSLKQSPEAYNRFLNELKRLALFEFADSSWHLGRDVSSPLDVRAQLEAELIADPEAAGRSGHTNFAPAIAWFLMQDPVRPPVVGENWHPHIERDCPGEDAFELSNEERSRQFAYWVVFFGFGWRLGTGGDQVLVPDPTDALRRHFRAAFAPGDRLSLIDAIGRVAKDCPVFEGGATRESVAATAAARLSRPPAALSRSTSFALERLADEGVLRLESDADAAAVTLDLWPDRRVVTHVVLADGGA